MSEPLTYKRFLECLDQAAMEVGRVQRMSTNRRTLSLLLNDTSIRHLAPACHLPESCMIMGIPIDIDNSLPDHAIKLDGRLYNTDTPSLVCCPICGYPLPLLNQPRAAMCRCFRVDMTITQKDGTTMKTTGTIGVRPSREKVPPEFYEAFAGESEWEL